MIRYFHIATQEYMNSEEVQKRLDEGFDFKCNECGESIGEHLKVLSEGIFCPKCFKEIMEAFA